MSTTTWSVALDPEAADVLHAIASRLAWSKSRTCAAILHAIVLGPDAVGDWLTYLIDAAHREGVDLPEGWG